MAYLNWRQLSTLVLLQQQQHREKWNERQHHIIYLKYIVLRYCTMCIPRSIYITWDTPHTIVFLILFDANGFHTIRMEWIPSLPFAPVHVHLCAYWKWRRRRGRSGKNRTEKKKQLNNLERSKEAHGHHTMEWNVLLWQRQRQNHSPVTTTQLWFCAVHRIVEMRARFIFIHTNRLAEPSMLFFLSVSRLMIGNNNAILVLCV